VNGSERVIPANQFKCNGATGAGPAFDVGNDTSGEGGMQSVISATARSVNGAFASMAQKLDLCQIRDVAASMGAHRADGAELEPNPSSILGTNTIAPMTMAASVATIAANGVYCAPTAVDRIVNSAGEELPGQAAECTQAIEPNIAATAAYALERVFTNGTATSANPYDDIAIMGKTGTTDGSHQNWLIGSTTKVAIAVWVGNIEGNPAKRTTANPAGEQSLRRITVARTNGANIKFIVFEEMLKAFNSNPAYAGDADFPAPDPALVSGRGAAPRNTDVD